MAAEKKSLEDLAMDSSNLYKEETITDRKVGTIRTLIPVKSDGSADDSREVEFVGETQIMTPMGALPINFQIEAKTLDEAVEKYGDAGKEAVEKAVKELQQMRREAASSIVLPEGMGGGAGPVGGIKLP
ncbi:MAG: hypothetical protein VW776_05385 [Betaproteobacteria bacterium]